MPSESVGRTVSVRMPAGAIEELRAATGVPFSRLVRWTMMALLERKRLERSQALRDGLGEVKEVVATMPTEVLNGKA